MNVVITGANRGIGLGFVRHYLNQGNKVWAGHRDDLGGLDKVKSANLHLFWIDVSSYISAHVLNALPEKIDLLINNAGIYGPREQSLHNVSAETMLDVFNVDCVGPLRLVQRLRKRVVAAKGTIANVSSKMGSSDDNASGGTYAYRAAKAGLVIVSRSMAIDLAPEGVRVITLHPGWVRTDMGGSQGLIDVETSVAGMANIIAHVDDFQPGAFVAYDGKLVPY